jgi:hypothetical protein
MYNEFEKNVQSFLYDTFEYIKENFFGIVLLILSICIIFIVDYITQINNSIFSIPPIVHTFTKSNQKKIKNKKLH